MKFTYDDIKQKLESGGGMDVSPTDSGAAPGTPVQGAFVGAVAIDIPQLPKVSFPMEDLTFDSDIKGKKQDLYKVLGLKLGGGGIMNDYAGSQIIINSDRLILNSRTDYLMLFGNQGVAISSQGNVNIDSDQAVTIYGEEGLFLGVPGKGKGIEEGGGNVKAPKTKGDPTLDNDYEPLVLGTKLANLVEDLLVVLKNATMVTPVGKSYFREDAQYEFACLQARIPEILSTYGYIDGVSHEAPDPQPAPPSEITEPPTTLTGTVTGTFTGSTSAIDPNAPSNTITNPLGDQPDFFMTEQIY